MNSQNKKSGYKWEGFACLSCFFLATLILCFGNRSPISLLPFFLLGLLGACFGLSYMRTWKNIYRNALLGILFIAALLLYLASSLYTIPSTPGELDKPTKAPAVPKKN